MLNRNVLQDQPAETLICDSLFGFVDGIAINILKIELLLSCMKY